MRILKQEEFESKINEMEQNYACNLTIKSTIEQRRTEDDETTVSKPELEIDKETKQITPTNEIAVDRQDEEQMITELVETTTVNQNSQLMEVPKNNSHMRIAYGILVRLVLPLANGLARSIQSIRDARLISVLQSIASSRQALANLLAFAANTISMNLSTVQVSHRIEPILKLMKIRKSRDGLESLPDSCSNGELLSTPFTPLSTPSSPILRSPKYPNFNASPRKTASVLPEQPASKCCSLKILAEPPPGQPIRADIIFIHGLHGSLVNTWKQGLWENERHPVEFNRPPKPPVRPPKRSRHSRSTHIRPPHKHKRARMGHLEELFKQSMDIETQEERNDFTYICGEPQDIKFCEGVEYSFPTFRIRMNDSGRLVQQSELKSTIINEAEDSKENEKLNHDTNATAILKDDTKSTKSKSKITANDPNYSKCWPADWLPLDCPGVRVIAINYTTDQYLWRPLWKNKEPRTSLVQRAREMAELLIEQRVGHNQPIVWVGHSKGGLYIKQLIVDAWESGRPAMTPFWRSARGCFFYSVPHRGSHLASIKAPLLTRSVELLDIEKNNKYLLDLHRRFAGLYHLGHLKIEVFSFVETALTLMSVLYLRIVGADSADPGIGDVCGIRLDHREICKPRGRDCILYKQLVKMIKKVC